MLFGNFGKHKKNFTGILKFFLSITFFCTLPIDLISCVVFAGFGVSLEKIVFFIYRGVPFFDLKNNFSLFGIKLKGFLCYIKLDFNIFKI